MGYTNNVDVICQISKDGSIIPMRIRLQDEEQVYQIYKIASYRELASDTIQLPNEAIVTNNIRRYDCKIEVLGVLKHVVLHYNKTQVKWYIYY